MSNYIKQGDFVINLDTLLAIEQKENVYHAYFSGGLILTYKPYKDPIHLQELKELYEKLSLGDSK